MVIGTGVAVRVSMGSPILFRQDRVGKDEAIFRIYKFRSMRDPAYPGEPDEARLTRVGRFIRSTSLDELPQLLNVLKGDMSLVGPRPLLVRYLPRYSPRQRLRHSVLPGLTGWAQVSGRNSLSWEEKFEHDVWYVEHWSVGLDLKIALRSVKAVLRRSGVSAEGQATMSEFMGSTPAEAL